MCILEMAVWFCDPNEFFFQDPFAPNEEKLQVALPSRHTVKSIQSAA